MKTILFFGDSLTAGYGLSDAKNDSFPGLIQRKITEASLSYEVVNAGISGDTSGGGLARLDYWLSRPIDVFILELGINDIMRGINPRITFQNLQAIIDKVKIKNPKVQIAVMGMELPPFVPGSLTLEFRQIFRKLSDANRLTLVPFFLDGVAGIQHLNLNDGLHPSAEGYKVIANKVWPVIKPLLV
ncbi:MAG: arylesterase [Cyclobacteriaceae bacterium]|nr:arylesterase [Cyclobacteriaceae bacterium]